jgi:CubicO group peptidase (beta-lactamase class C family)
MRFWVRFAFLISALGMLLNAVAFAQGVAPPKVDQISSAYEKPGSPGCSLGVIRNGDFIYRKAYGSANLELLEFRFRRSPFFTWVPCRSD